MWGKGTSDVPCHLTSVRLSDLLDPYTARSTITYANAIVSQTGVDVDEWRLPRILNMAEQIRQGAAQRSEN